MRSTYKFISTLLTRSEENIQAELNQQMVPNLPVQFETYHYRCIQYASYSRVCVCVCVWRGGGGGEDEWEGGACVACVCIIIKKFLGWGGLLLFGGQGVSYFGGWGGGSPSILGPGGGGGEVAGQELHSSAPCAIFTMKTRVCFQHRLVINKSTSYCLNKGVLQIVKECRLTVGSSG